MNEVIPELAVQAVEHVDIVTGNELFDDELARMYIPNCFIEKFAELILKEAIKVMNREWYELNEKKHPEKESDRDIGFRVGQKSQTLLLMGKIKKHFGVE